MGEAGAALHERVWRARRRHSYIDAFVRPAPPEWVLEFRHDGRVFLTWRFPTAEAASAEAFRRLADLQRSGWNTHW